MAAKSQAILCVVVALLRVSSGDLLDCYSCSNVSSASECHNTVQCGQNENCFTDVLQVADSLEYTFGCKIATACASVMGVQVLVGKRDVTDPASCHQCCPAHGCNKHLCWDTVVNPAAVKCEDDPNYNCKMINDTFNVCADIQHANTVCRKFCVLCDYADGHWAPWSSWSDCSVTCENGTRSRSRTCTNPPPTHGGHDCRGDAVETNSCNLPLCPVHGGWSAWTTWDVCSVTCGTGVTHGFSRNTANSKSEFREKRSEKQCTRRHRSCTSPAPQRFGRHCFGDGIGFNICQMTPCEVAVDGGWTAWSSWGPCSVTCGNGLRRRERNCSNPSPASGGRDCHGDYHDYKACSVIDDCLWTPWGNWGAWVSDGSTDTIKRYRHCRREYSLQSSQYYHSCSCCHGNSTDTYTTSHHHHH